MSTQKEQVVAVVGKRGSGKSFTLGVIAEGLAAVGSTPIAEAEGDRAVLLFDPLDVYWTTRYGVAPSENAEAQRHFSLASASDLLGIGFAVDAWIPGAANRRNADPPWFRTLELPVPGLGLEEWELLLGVNALTDPMGQAFADVLTLVGDTGYHIRGEEMSAEAIFDLSGLANATGADELSGYHRETIRALRQRLTALQGSGLFSGSGTLLGDLLQRGRLTIVMLGRIPQSYRSAVVAVITRMLIDHRSEAAFAEKRVALDPSLDADESRSLRRTVVEGVPRTVVMLDEAQSFLAPGESNLARGLFVRLVKEGRNMGLSAVLATQQPSALDTRVLSQVETFIAHQLVTEPDIRAVRDNLKARLPDRIQYASQELDFPGLMRQLPPGIAIVSPADVNTAMKRTFIANIRPRATVHGGIEL